MPTTLAARLGIEQLVNETVDLSGRPGGARPGRKVLTLCHAMHLGGDSDGSVIPVWYPDEAPTFESEITDKGGIVFTSASPPSAELDSAVDDLSSALEGRLAARQPNQPFSDADAATEA